MTEPLKYEVAPSILAADFARLGEEIGKVESVSGRIHVDVMDGHYVPNLTIGVPVIRSIRKVTDLILDVHLMVTDPLRFVVPFAEAGSDVITVHVETLENPIEAIELIRSVGKKAGLSIHPDTPVEVLFPYLAMLDNVLIMSVRPGFGGQEFMPEAMGRIRRIRAEMDRMKSSATLSVDGGISKENARAVVNAGGRILVIGSAVFESINPKKAVEDILKCAM
ncbi:MAG: ribulose-phosphate 3-epimerase [Clostridiaceae bacterium]|nr:ribulose-phosphate 3-epimerase [Clostridiaceae bacterium]